MAKKKKPTLGENAEIDSAGALLTKQWLNLTTGWIVRDRDHDVFVDYEIERTEAGEPTGKIFYAQLKSHRSVTPKNSNANEVIETKHLKYYADCHIPVFLFVVDITARTGYWVFIQEWLENASADSRLSEQASMTVTVPVANRLDDTPALLSATRKAAAFMREKHPGSVNAAINSDIARLTAIDPRFDIKLAIIDSKKHYSLSPREPVPFRLKIAGEHTKAFQELIEYGRPLNLPSGTVEFEGFPLLDALKSEGMLTGLNLTPAISRQCDLEFWVEGDLDSPRIRLEGRIAPGTAGLLYIGGLESLPLKVEIKTPPLTIQRPAVATMTVSWDWSAWSGIELLSLPYFDALHSLSRAASEGKSIQHRFSFQGGRLTAGVLGKRNDTPFAAPALLLATLAKARAVATTVNAKPILPPVANLTNEDFREIEYAYAILLGSGYQISGTGISFSITLNELKGSTLEALSQPGASGSLRVDHPTQFGRIFGTQVPLGHLEYTLEPAETVVDKEALEKCIAGDADELAIEVVGLGKATYNVRKLLG
jgi:hypothetical protein